MAPTTSTSAIRGASPATSTSPPPTSPATSGAAPSVSPFDGGQRANLGAVDNGSTLSPHVGATITVQLTATPGYRWSRPASSDSSIVAVASATQTADGGASAVLRSVAPGTVQLTATDDPTCLPSCGRPSLAWRVIVVVAPHPVP